MTAAHTFDASAITRPHERLLTYYLIVSLLTLLAFPVTFIPLYVKYRTLRYRFDEEGIWRVSWLPDEPDSRGQLSGRTYTPGDADLPSDFPATNDPDDLMEWAVRRWGP